MNGDELVRLLDAALERLATHRDELRDLDAALGDGDLGITVGKGCDAVRERLRGLADPAPAEVVRAAGLAFAAANPSTMAALVGGALLAGAKALGDVTGLGHSEALALTRAAADSVAARGKAGPGDKTLLDALLPSLDALAAASPGDALAAMIDAARRAVTDTAALQSRKGRAAWLGERSAGHPDPGATAFLRLLESLQSCWEIVQ